MSRPHASPPHSVRAVRLVCRADPAAGRGGLGFVEWGLAQGKPMACTPAEACGGRSAAYLQWRSPAGPSAASGPLYVDEPGTRANHASPPRAWPSLHGAWPALGVALLALPGLVQAADSEYLVALATSTEAQHVARPSADLRLQIGPQWFDAHALDSDRADDGLGTRAAQQHASFGRVRDEDQDASRMITVADDVWDGVMTPRNLRPDSDAASLASLVRLSAMDAPTTGPLPGNEAFGTAHEAAHDTARRADRSAQRHLAGHADMRPGTDDLPASGSRVIATAVPQAAPSIPVPPSPPVPRQATMAAPPDAGLRRRAEARAHSALAFDTLADPGMLGLPRVATWFDTPAVTVVADASGSPQHSLETASQAMQADMTPAGPSIDDLPLRAYRYIPSGTEHEEVQRPPEEQRLIELNLTGDYPALAREGRALLAQRKVDDQLRFIIANAMAWTGELHAAEQHYAELASGEYALDAKVAMANILRWRGKDDQALPIYREVLASMPDHTDALNAVAASEAALRPRSRVSLQGARDSDDIMVRELRLNHAWRTHEAKRTWEVDQHAMRDKSPFVKDLQSGITVRHQRLDWKMRPSFELGVADSLYGSVSVTPTKWPLTVTAGRVNWAQMSYNPRGLQAGMTAWNLGAKAALDGRWGRLNMVADAYRVDDGNVVTTATARYQPGIRLPLGIRSVVGFEHRKSNFNTLNYWSPNDGYGLTYAGLEREWSRGTAWQLNLSVQRGWRVYGEAGSSWGAGLSGRVRIGKQWVLGANAWGVNNAREGRPYRARSVTAFLERRW